MPKLKPEEIETRRREIIEAARVCFLRHGFHQTTTDEICKEAAITPGGLYHYFGSKEEIISAVIDDAARAAVSRLGEQDSGDALTTVRALAEMFNQSVRDPELDERTRLDLEIWAETVRNEKLSDVMQLSWAIRRGWLESLIKRGIAEGVYAKDVDASGLANLILAIWLGLRVGRVIWKDHFDPDTTLQALFLMQTGQLTQAPVLQ
jgi:AcrR family transcriptional regulator